MNRDARVPAMWWVLALALVLFGIWGQQQMHSASAALPIRVKTVALTPASIPVVTANLSGQLEGLAVITEVDGKTGKSLETPDLRATLRLRNITKDQAIRLVKGRVEYVGASGAVIPLTKDQGTTDFTFYPDQQDDVLPGQQMSQVIRVPFPAAALKASALHDIRLHLTYSATPYGSETVDNPVTVAG